MYWRWKIIYLYVLFNTFWLLMHVQQNLTEASVSEPTIDPNASDSNKNLHKGNVTTSVLHHPKDTIAGRGLEISTRMVATECTTPNNEKAFCIPLNNCSKLLNQRKNKKAESFFEQSKCGPKNEDTKNPHVCCGKYDNYKDLVDTCGYQNVTLKGRILGGKEAALGEFPWMARLIHKDGANARVFGCSGFLITPKFVLTAAHCLKSENIDVLGRIYEVQLGEHDTKTKIDCNTKNTTCADKPQVARVKRILVHQSYKMKDKHHHNDIGLIFLKKAAKLSNYVFPICIMDVPDFEPFEYWLSGWGSTRETGPISHVKMKVSVPPISRSNCTTVYDSIQVKIIDKQLCAGGKKNQDSCTGDSGGPLMFVKDGRHWFAAGVVSYGLGCGREGWPAVYTNITSYADWITKTMSETLQNDKKSNNSKNVTKVTEK